MPSKPKIHDSDVKCQAIPKKSTKSAETGLSQCYRPRFPLTVDEALARQALRQSRQINNMITEAVVDYLADRWYDEHKPVIKERIIQGMKINI